MLNGNCEKKINRGLLMFFSIPFAKNSVPFCAKGNIFHFLWFLKDYFYWENLFMKDGFSFKAELQYKTTSDRYKARKKGASLVAQTVENLPAMQETWVQSSVGKIPWRREWQPTPTFLPGTSQGQRSLVGYSLWDLKKSDTTGGLNNTGTRLTLFMSQLPPCRTKPHSAVSDSVEGA